MMTLKQWCLDLAQKYRDRSPELLSGLRNVKGICTIAGHAAHNGSHEIEHTDYLKLVRAIDEVLNPTSKIYLAPRDPNLPESFDVRASFLESFAETLP